MFVFLARGPQASTATHSVLSRPTEKASCEVATEVAGEGAPPPKLEARPGTARSSNGALSLPRSVMELGVAAAAEAETRPMEVWGCWRGGCCW